MRRLLSLTWLIKWIRSRASIILQLTGFKIGQINFVIPISIDKICANPSKYSRTFLAPIGNVVNIDPSGNFHFRAIIILAIIFGILCSSTSRATDYYVNATTGNNTTGDGTSGNPWKTITYSLEQISGSGHTLYVSTGTYNASLGETFPIVMKDGVSMVGAGMDVSIIDAGGANTVIRCVSIVDAATRLEGFTVKGGGNANGGGLYISAGSILTVTNNKISGSLLNYTYPYGAGMYITNASPVITNNTITGNEAYYGGGGIYMTSSSPRIINNTISGNATNYSNYNGSAIYAVNSSPVIQGNVITGNTDAYSCLYFDGSTSAPRIINNVIAKNSGNGIECLSSSHPQIINNTISDNTSSGIFISSASPDSIVNNIVSFNAGYGIYENSSISDPQKVWYNLFHANGSGLYRDEGTTDYYTVSPLNASVAECQYNISADPMFVDKTNNDYHLRFGSPAIDAGEPALSYDNEPLPNGSRINIGAYGNTSSAMISGGSGGANLSDYYAATTGSNTTGDGSSGNPWKTITYALSQINGTGTTNLHVSAGTYNMALGETFPILMKDGVSMVGAGMDMSIIDAGGINTVVRCVGIVDATTKVEGFTIKRGGNANGGGLYISAGSVLKVTNNKITGTILTYSYPYGAGLLITNASPLILNNTITGNEAYYGGGGIYLTNSSAMIINNTITANATSYSNYDGAGIYSVSSSPLIQGNVITGNTDAYSCLYFDGSTSAPRIINNVIAKNSGNGIECLSSSHPQIINNTISDNTSSGIYISSASPDSIFNNIISNNSGYGIHESGSTSDPGKAWHNLFYANGLGLYRDEGTTDYYTASSLNSSVAECQNNISGDPMFVDKINNDYHLRLGSPAIDAGDPNSSLDPDGTRADIGAYFFDTPPAAPTGLSATRTPSGFELNWNANADADLSKYVVYRSLTNNFTPSNSDSIAVILQPTTTYMDNSVISGNIYYYKIAAVDLANNKSSASSQSVGDFAPPTSPAILINNGANRTANLNVSLTLSSAGADSMMFSGDISAVSGGDVGVYMLYEVNQSVMLTSVEGVKQVNVTYKDAAGNTSSTVSAAIILDTTPPGTPTGLTATRTDTSINLSWNANAEADLLGYTVYRSQTNDFSPSNTDSIVFVHMLSASYVDQSVVSGNIYYYKISAVDSLSQPSPPSAQAIGDYSGPTSTSIVINGGIYRTGLTDVTLTLSAVGADSMKLTGDIIALSGGSAGVYLAYGISQNATLTPGDGNKIIRVSYKDPSGNVITVSDNIILDTTPPGAPAGLTATRTDTSINLSWTANSESDVWFYIIYKSLTSNFTPSSSDSLGNVIKPVTNYIDMSVLTGNVYYYKIVAVDSLSNWSSPSSQAVGDCDPPALPSITINSGALATNNVNAIMSLNAVGADSMKITGDVTGSNVNKYIVYTTTSNIALTNGDGTKTVSVVYKDAAGNISATVSDTILFDTAPPTAPAIVINNGANLTNNINVSLTLSSNGADSLKITGAVTGSNTNQFILYNTIQNVELTSGDGNKIVSVEYKDLAGNLSSAVSDTVLLDTGAPASATIVINGLGAINIEDSFDPDIDFTQWISLTGATASTNCGSVSGNSLYFDGTLRNADTKDINVLQGGTVEFYLEIGSGSAPCENADAGEDVSLQYSTNGGSSWIEINTYNVDSYSTFTLIQEAIPDSAKTTSTRFRWMQASNSGAGFDNWSIDNVTITGTGVGSSGAQRTTNTNVTLTLNAAGADSMKFTGDLTDVAGGSVDVYKAYATSQDITLTAGDGNKTVYVEYKDIAGNISSASDDIVLDMTTPPNPPQNLTVALGTTSATLHWNKNSESDFLRYRVYKSILPNASTQVDSTMNGIGDTTKTITGLTTGTTYYFRITAIDSNYNQSAYSNEVSAIPAPSTSHYVSAASGSNSTGDGSQGNPWKTITFALSQFSGTGHTLLVESGTYDAALGESFPIYMKNGLSLLGAGIQVSIINANGTNLVLNCSGLVDSTTRIEGFTITGGNNPAVYGGGLYISAGSRLTVANNLIWGNTCNSWGFGGGIYITNSAPLIISNQISANNPGSFGHGGGIYITDASPLIDDNFVSDNTTIEDGYGGGIYVTGTSSKPRIVHNVIVNNHGDGIVCSGSAKPKILNNTISDNKIPDSFGSASDGIYAISGPDSILNNIISQNAGFGIREAGSASDPNKVWYNLFYANSLGLYKDEGTTDYFTASTVDASVAEVKNNIDGDPVFVDRVNYDYRITSLSSAVDAGDPNSPFDPDGTRADIGAYPFYQTSVPPAAPQNLQAAAANGVVNLQWTNNKEQDFLRYRIFVGTSPGPISQADSVEGKYNTTKTITGLLWDTRYYFRITAVDSNYNQSGYSNEVDVLLIAPRTLDSLALIAIYDSTGGDNWTDKSNWKTSNPIDTWFGVTVNGGRVTAFATFTNNLVGSIPSEIGNLTSLQYLYLGGNLLIGSIPEQIGNLTSLVSLQLQGNQLSGGIPGQIGNLANLTYLDLNSNQLSGAIPSQIGNLTNLQSLQLQGNELTSSMPSQIGSLINLSYIDVSNNQLSGAIPNQIGNLTQLIGLWLNGNQLTGIVPIEIFNLTNLTTIGLHGNPFSPWQIPDKIGNLTELTFIRFQNDSLYGPIPDTLANLRQLQHLYLGGNQITGTIPPRLGVLDSLRTFDCAYNRLQGNIPNSFGNLIFLQTILLRSNKLSGFPDLSSLAYLQEIEIQDNQFTFEDIEPLVPKNLPMYNYSPQDSVGRQIDTTVVPGGSITFAVSVGGANNLYQWFFNGAEIVVATGNSFTISNASAVEHNGTYTCRITNSLATALTLYSRSIYLSVQQPPRYLDSLALVDLYDSTGGASWTNQTNWKTSNPIDTWYGVTVVNNRVQQLWLVNNNLSGHIPASIGSLTALTHLSLRPDNLNVNLGGIIPSSIGNLTKLVVFQLSNNRLTGDIPSSIGNLTEVEVLTLDANLLTGSIPNTLGNLRKLQHLNFSGNQLSGSIPDVLATMDSLKELLMSGNQLTGTMPNSVYSLGGLKSIHLEANMLSGGLSASLGSLTNVDDLCLYGNQFTGTIPSTIGNLTELRNLSLEINSLSGSIPTSMGNLAKLEYLGLYSNQLSGSIPAPIGNLTNLQNLLLAHNQLSGSIPVTIGNLTKLESLLLDNNQLTDTIPSAIGNLTNLQYVILSSNQLSGSAPVSLSGLKKIKNLDLSYNRLVDLPDLSPVDSLKTLSINNNKFTFEDIEPNIGAPSQTFTYSPQDSVGAYKDTSRVQGSSLSLSVTIGGTNNQYQWMKNGTNISGATSSVLNLPSLTVTDSGKYHCGITNTLATQLTLNSRTTKVTVFALPSAPANLTATAVSASQINLSWTASSNTTKYRIYRSLTSGSGFSQIDSVTATTYNNTGLSVITTYYYRIVAVNAYGVSSNSNEASATTTAIAPAIVGTPGLSNSSPIPGAAVTVTVLVSGTSPAVKLFYGKISQLIGDSAVMNFGGTYYTATIPGISVTQEGVWYRIRVHNTGGIAYYPSAAGKTNIPVTINDMATIWDNSLYYGGIEEEQYFSIALSMSGTLSLTNLWGVQMFEAGVPTNWRAWRFNAVSQAFEDVTSLAGNEAYFMFHRRGSAQEIFNGVTSRKTNDPLFFDNFVLKNGWNAVPWPYTFPANLYIKDTDHDSIGSVWKLYGNSGWEQATEMRAFGGYMIYNKTGGDLTAGSVVNWTMMTPKRTADLTGWRLRFIAESGQYRDAYNFAGVSENYSTLSEPEPLNMGKNIALNFKHYTEILSSDIRPANENGHVWEMAVQNTTGQARAKLRWETEQLPPDVKVMLIDITNNKILNLSETNPEYEFRTQKQNTFKLVAGKANYVDREVNKIKAELPNDFRLSQNYPNPFNSATTIRFDVAHGSYVRIKVYNLLGQEVAVITDRYYETGRNYSVEWGGKDALGRQVASGIYLYRLEAGKISKVKKLMLVK